MLLKAATESDYPEIVTLANLAFRGTGPTASWNSEAAFLEGQRLDDSILRQDLAAKPNAHLLTCREQNVNSDHSKTPAEQKHPLLGTVWLEPKENATWYLGLLTIRPDLQNRQLGRALLAAAEDYAKQRGAQRIRMTVINVRNTLIAWYQRRGYTVTAETQPFPYGDQRFGKPLRDDLHFVVLEKDL